MKKIKIILFSLLCFIFTSTIGTINCKADDYTNSILSNIVFLPNNNISRSTSIDGLSVIIGVPIPSYLDIPYNIYSNKTLYDNIYKFENNRYGVTIIGTSMTFINNTDLVMIVKSNQSNITIGDYSSILFMDGMKYDNAGNPSATPDIVIPPHQTIHRDLLISRCEFNKGKWIVNGIPLLKTNDLTESLYLKIEFQDGSSQYIQIITPPIGVSL